MSVYRGFPSRCSLNCNRIEPAAKKKDEERLITGLTIGRRKLQLKYKFCFELQRSFADKFSVPWAYFLHEQRVSLNTKRSYKGQGLATFEALYWLFCGMVES